MPDKKSNRLLTEKLEIIKENVELGSFDSSFLAISIFLSTLILSFALNPEYVKHLTNNFFQTQFFLFLVTFAFSMICVILCFFLIVFIKAEQQFKQRIIIFQLFYFYLYTGIFTLLLSIVVSITRLFVLLYVTEKILNRVTLGIQIIGITLIIISSLRKNGHLRNLVHNRFKNQFPNLYTKNINNKNKKGVKMKTIIKDIVNWFKKSFTLDRFMKAFLFAVTIGLGVYLGNIFLQFHWLIALALVTLILMILAGNLLDVLYPSSKKHKLN